MKRAVSGAISHPRRARAQRSAPDRNSAALNAFRRQLDVLSTEYRRSLPGKFAEIDELWRKLADGATDSLSIAGLQRELHTLAGSAKTFGVAGVSEAAAAAEAFLEPYCAHGAIPRPAARDKFRVLLDALRRAGVASEK